MAIHQITNPSNALGPIWIKNTWIAPGETYRWYENDPGQTTAYIKAYPISEVPMSHDGLGRNGSYVTASTGGTVGGGGGAPGQTSLSYTNPSNARWITTDAGNPNTVSYVATPTYDELVAENDRLRAAAKTSVDTKCATIQHNRELMNALSVVMTCLSELEVKHLTAIEEGVRRVKTDRATQKAIRRA
jgi:hypothetical protein